MFRLSSVNFGSLRPFFFFFSVVSSGSNRSSGCLVLYRPVLSFVKSWVNSDGRFLQCEFLFREVFCVVSLYARNHNNQGTSFFILLLPLSTGQSPRCFVEISIRSLIALWIFPCASF